MKKVVLVLLFIVSVLHAEVKDKFKVSVGVMHVVNFETEMQVAPKNAPIGVRINTQDQLKMKNDTNVFRLDGYYRFNEEDSIDFSYYSVNSDGVTGESIEWDGDSIVSADLHSVFNMDIYKINYAYSFYHNEKVELALTAGLHITATELGIWAYGTVNGVADSYYDSRMSYTIPLPVVGFKGEYRINKEMFVNYRVDYLYLEYDGWKGALVTSFLNFEYRFMDNYGVGLGYNTNRIKIEGKDSNLRYDVSNVLSGVVLSLSYIY